MVPTYDKAREETERTRKMRITDYETNRSLNDIGVVLTIDEADELCAYLQSMQKREGVNHIHLSEIVGNKLEREITVTLEKRVSLA